MSSFGSAYKITTFGESHCKSVGVVIDGVPSGLALTEDDIQTQLKRRRPGQSALTTPRSEHDQVSILSGTEMGTTLGTPIAMTVNNLDHRPRDYTETDLFPRPSHADYTYLMKYGVKASSGGGRASARETIGRVAAGALAEKYLKEAYNMEIVAFVSAIGNVSIDPTTPILDSSLILNEVLGSSTFDVARKISESIDSWKSKWTSWWNTLKTVTRDDVDKNEVRCPDEKGAEEMRDLILKLRERNDSIGGTITCVIRGCPPGLGEPCFDKLEAKLAHAMLSIPATKGFEIGSGFSGTAVPGSIHNDPFVEAVTKEEKSKRRLHTSTNFSGGIQGGISNGETVYFKVAFKPAATISRPQETTNYDGTKGILETRGRHDPSVLPRAVPIVESMAAIVIMDALCIQSGKETMSSRLNKDHVPSILEAKLSK